MNFTKIKLTEKGVELNWTTQTANGDITDCEFSSRQAPLKEFRQAMLAFCTYVCDLIGAPDNWDGEIIVTSLSLSQSKDGRRGLIVTAIRKIERASNRVLVINTPLMTEAGENTSEEASGILDDETLTLVKRAESKALAYYNGARVQIDAFENAEAAAEAPTPADDLTKARKKRQKKAVEAPVITGDVPPSAEPWPENRPN